MFPEFVRATYRGEKGVILTRYCDSSLWTVISGTYVGTLAPLDQTLHPRPLVLIEPVGAPS